MAVVLFEDGAWARMAPLNLLRHSALLRWGTRELADLVAADAELWGREELAEVTKELGKRGYNRRVESTALLVNARARPGRALNALAAKKRPFVALSGGEVVAARLNAGRLTPGVVTSRTVRAAASGAEQLDAQDGSLFSGYWDLVVSNGMAIAEQAGVGEGLQSIPETCRVRGPHSSLRIAGSAEIEDFVAFDTRSGPVLVDEGAAVESFSRITGPTYIGPRARIRSALVRGGTSVFEGCRIGGEVENTVFMPHSNKAHAGYVGDSYVGEWVNLGAGCTFSNLKNTYGNVRVGQKGRRADTGMLKLGPAVGDMAKASIGALVTAGRSVGAGSHVTGTAIADVPPFTYASGDRWVELLLESVTETQRRMKERRGLTLSKAEEALIDRAFRSTALERRRAGVKRGRLP